MYFIGIDGGGSTSRLLAVDKALTPIARHTGLATNLSASPFEVVRDNIHNLLRGFCEESGLRLEDCVSLCIGTAGVDGDRNLGPMESIFREAGYAGKLKIVPDAAIALMAKTKGAPGIVIISGTGSIGYAIDSFGKATRCGGWGAFIDDGGSGYKIGIEAIRYSLMAFDGRGQKTILTDKITKHFEIGRIDEVIKIVYALPYDKAKIAKLSDVVRAAASEGDEVALSIERQAAEDLALMAKTLAARNKCNMIVISGGILLNNMDIQSMFKRDVIESCPGVSVLHLDVEAEMGAIYLAASEYESQISAQ